MRLKSGALLQGGKYRIEKVLGQGGFGITYLATQDLLDRKVCIKEFFYKEYCERDEATSHVSLGTQSNHEIVERFLNKFLKEARTISQLEHPNIIKIHDIFKENNTAYYVMDYIEGQSLSEMVKQRSALPEAKAMEYIEQIASALYFIHQRSINHLDVKPANVMVRQSDGKVILIDFGLSKQYDAQGGQTSTTPVGISHGYAPMEQYKQGGVSTFSPETDIYALGATLYKMVTGDTPPQAMDVMNDGLPALPASLSSSVAGAIKKAMQPRKVDRFQSVDKFLNELKASAPASPFIQEKKEEKTHQIVDEETKVLNNSNTKAEEKKIQKEEAPQPSATFVGKDEKKDNTAKNGCSIFLIMGCFVLFFLLRECNGGDNSVDIVGVSQNKTLTNNELDQKAYAYYQNSQYEDAVKLWQQASNNGHANSQYNLGLCYSTGKGVTKNSELAKQWWEKAATQGHKEAKSALARLNKEEKNNNEQELLGMSNEVYSYLQEARNGNATAQFNLGWSYYNGDGVRKNYAEAVKWYRKSAEQGNMSAQNNLGFCLYEGQGVKNDYVEAAKWYRKAAEQGDAVAQMNIGRCYYDGKGVTKDYYKATEWYTKSAKQGNASAQFSLGWCYKYGQGITLDYAKAAEWFLKSAQQDYVYAQHELATYYYDCKNYQEAVRWWEKAVAKKHTESIYKLGYCYYEGYGVTQDFKKTEELWKKAANNNHEEAKKMLDFLYTSGLLSSENDEIYQDVEEMPSYPGGTENLMLYLQNSVQYPREAQENNIQGRVIVEFVVDRDGSIVDPKIQRKVDPLLDREALRVIRNMPKWAPGKKDGKPVRVKFTLPIQFRLQ